MRRSEKAQKAATSHNHASGNARVALQGSVVHGDVNLVVPPGAGPEEKFKTALEHLNSRSITTARKLMEEVVFEGHTSAEIWFYWLLAHLSRRTLRELTPAERDRLDEARRTASGTAGANRWTRGIKVIGQILDAAHSTGGQPASLTVCLAGLDAKPQAEIHRHLSLLLRDAVRNDTWRQDIEAAKRRQRAESRKERVWMFFEPNPREARVYPARAATVRRADRSKSGLYATILLGMVALLAWMAYRRLDAIAVAAAMASLTAGGIALAGAVEWRFRTDRLRDGDRQMRGARRSAPAGGFADQVDRDFARYANLCAPKDGNREAWFAETEGMRQWLRDEMVTVYRESQVSAADIKWLVRFQLRRLRIDWQQGTLFNHRNCFRVSWSLRAGTGVGGFLFVSGLLWVFQSAVRVNVLAAVGALVLAAITCVLGVRLWSWMYAEPRHIAEDEAERNRRLALYEQERARWQKVLDDRPSDAQMAEWLDCDLLVLLDQAMGRYELRRAEIQTYASLEAPGPRCRKARIRNGPWRYSFYEIVVFLLTREGVRQITVNLDFTHGTFHNWSRANYRFEAVAAVRVDEEDDGTRNFDLSLVSGENVEVRATDPTEAISSIEDPRILTDAALDAAGLRYTLFMLEGIAAEGRAWWHARHPRSPEPDEEPVRRMGGNREAAAPRR